LERFAEKEQTTLHDVVSEDSLRSVGRCDREHGVGENAEAIGRWKVHHSDIVKRDTRVAIKSRFRELRVDAVRCNGQGAGGKKFVFFSKLGRIQC